MKDGQPGECGETDGRSHVVGENGKSGPGGSEDAIVAESVYDGTHGVLADAEQEVAPGMIFAGKVTLLLEVVLGGAMEVGRTADKKR